MSSSKVEDGRAGCWAREVSSNGFVAVRTVKLEASGFKLILWKWGQIFLSAPGGS